MKFLPLILSHLTLLLLLGCVSRYKVSEDYRSNLSPQQYISPRSMTVVILVDGLPLYTLQSLFQKHQLKNIQKFFSKTQNKMYSGRSVFPSVTYANITSLLTKSPVNHHHIIGNKIVYNDKVVNFENPSSKKTLERITSTQDIFYKLNERKMNSVGLAHTFGGNATSHMQTDLKSGLAIVNKNYDYVDDKLIDAFKSLLEDVPESYWPDFVFLHLVGLDLTSHDRGPQSPEAIDYLKSLDHRLEPLFRVLERAEGHGKSVISLLTSDHGFDRGIEKFVSLEKSIYEIDDDVQILNEGRYLAVNFPASWPQKKRKDFLKEAAQRSSVGMVLYRSADTIHFENQEFLGTIEYTNYSCKGTPYALRTKLQKRDIKYHKVKESRNTYACPEVVDHFVSHYLPPFFITNMAAYFWEKAHPDAVILAKDHISFIDQYIGHHGGVSADEVMIPILLRNANFPTLNKHPHIEDLLKGFFSSR